jgi:hypothetical protein
VDFSPASGTDLRTANGPQDAYVCHYGSDSAYYGVTTWGGYDDPYPDWEAGYDVAVDNNGNVYAVGNFFGEAFGTPSHGGSDGVVAKYDGNLNLQWTAIFGGTTRDYCYGVTTDQWNRIFVTGDYEDTVDFDPTSGVDEHTCNGVIADCFLVKMYSDGQW